MVRQGWKRRGMALCVATLLIGTLGGCASPQGVPPSPASAAPQETTAPEATRITDDLGREIAVAAPQRVVALYGSYAEAWLLAGGELAGTTRDAVEERKMELGDGVEIVGTVKEPNLERILALEPDFVLLNPDIEGQMKLDETLEVLSIPHAYFQGDTYRDYLRMMAALCAVTGRADLYERNAGQVEEQIQAVLAKVPQAGSAPTALLIRAFSTGAKAKGADNLAGAILEDLGADNIAARQEGLLEDLSLEAIIQEDPQFILVVTMGDEGQALEALKVNFEDNPGWAGLQAVQSGRYAVLPRELFHYKPNARWGESYAYLAKILYPDME